MKRFSEESVRYTEEQKQKYAVLKQHAQEKLNEYFVKKNSFSCCCQKESCVFIFAFGIKEQTAKLNVYDDYIDQNSKVYKHNYVIHNCVYNHLNKKSNRLNKN